MTASHLAPAEATEDLLDFFGRMIEIRLFEDEIQRLFTQNSFAADTSLQRPGGCRGRCLLGAAGRRHDALHLPRSRGGARDGGAARPHVRRDPRQAQGLCAAREARCTSPTSRVGALGSFAIVGAPPSVRYRLRASPPSTPRPTRCAVCFFGDGTTNIGAFHEALNLRSVWKLPVVFLCENNLYGEYSPLAHRRRRSRGSPIGLRVLDAVAASTATRYSACAKRGRGRRPRTSRRGPDADRGMTYRQKGHSRTDPGTYRAPGEVEAWMERDPILGASAARSRGARRLRPRRVDGGAGGRRRRSS